MTTEPLEDVYDRIADLCTLLRTIKTGGARCIGFQPGLKGYLALFDHPLVNTTLALAVSDVTAERVTEKIVGAARARFESGD